jgi:hypothetical protein
MRYLYLLGVVAMMTGCSIHPSRCGGAMRPINKSVVGADLPATGREALSGHEISEPHP